MSDGVGPLMLKMLVEDLCNSEAAFTLMYDETTTVQVKKQMDILMRYWSESAYIEYLNIQMNVIVFLMKP